MTDPFTADEPTLRPDPDESPGGSVLAQDSYAASRGAIALAIAQVATRLLQLAFIAVLARAVNIEDFGRYSVVAALTLFGGFLADAGTTPALVRLASRQPTGADRLLRGTLGVSLALGIVGWGAVTGAAAALYGRTVAIDMLIAGVSIPLTSAASSIHGVLDGIGKIHRRAWVGLAQPVVATLTGAGLVLLWHDVRAAMFGLAAGSAVLVTASIVTARSGGLLRATLRPDVGACREVFRIAMPFALFAGLGVLSGRFDVLLLGAVDGTQSAAAYDVALRACESIWGFHAVVTGPALYVLSGRLGRGDHAGAQRTYGFAVRTSYLVGAYISVVLVVFRGELLAVLGAAGYDASDGALAVLGSVLWLTLVALVQGTVISAGDHLREGLTTAALVTAATLVLDVVLIPTFHVTGAAIAGAATSIITVLAFAALHRRTVSLRTPAPRPHLLAATGFAVAVGLALRAAPAGLGMTGTTAAFLVGAFVARAVPPEDVERFRSVLRTRRRAT